MHNVFRFVCATICGASYMFGYQVTRLHADFMVEVNAIAYEVTVTLKLTSNKLAELLIYTPTPSIAFRHIPPNVGGGGGGDKQCWFLISRQTQPWFNCSICSSCILIFCIHVWDWEGRRYNLFPTSVHTVMHTCTCILCIISAQSFLVPWQPHSDLRDFCN